MALCADRATFPNSAIGLAAADSCVGQAYQTLLFRDPDQQGLDYWSNWLVTSNSEVLSLYLSLIVAAPQSTVYPNTPDGLISAGYMADYVYGWVLNRQPAPSERQYWSDQAVVNGWTFGHLRDTITAAAQAELNPPPAPAPRPVASPPVPAPVAPQPVPVASPPTPVQQQNLPPASQSQIESWFELYLCRPADAAGLAYWMNQPDAANTQASIAASGEAQAVLARGGCSAPAPPQKASSGISTPLLIGGAGVAAVVGIILATKPSSPVRPNAERVTPAA